MKPDQEQFIIKCSHCQATYVSETGRNLTNKYKRATKRGDLNNNIVEHHLKTSHTIESRDSATCLNLCMAITITKLHSKAGLLT